MAQHTLIPDDDPERRRHLHAVDAPADALPPNRPPDSPHEPGEVVSGPVVSGPGIPDAPGAALCEGSGLRAGDAIGDLDALTAPPVDGHLITLPPATLTERFKATQDGQRAPVLPAWVTDPKVRAHAVRRVARTLAYTLAFRAVRAPLDALTLTWWALVGGVRLSRRVLRWVLDLDGHPLIGTVTAQDDRAYVRMAHDRTIRQKFRFSLLAILTALVTVLVLVVRARGPWWVLPVATLALVLALARHGTASRSAHP